MALPALKDSQSASAAPVEGQLFELAVEKTDLGSPDSLRYNILTWVLDERYDKAIEELKDFLERPSEYPNFKSKITRFVFHSIDLIYAIKAKRSFPGIGSLTRAKQQELREKFKEHFRELGYVLKIVEKIHTDLRIQDVRSTIYVVKALWLAGLSIIVLAFWLDVVHGLARTSYVVFDEIFSNFANWITTILGL